ncbi:MAG: hypothetical protein ACPGUD_03760 [Parashewanella sp.]
MQLTSYFVLTKNKDILLLMLTVFVMLVPFRSMAATEAVGVLRIKPVVRTIHANEEGKLIITIANTDSIPNFRINGRAYTVDSLPDNFTLSSTPNGINLIFTSTESDAGKLQQVQAYFVYYSNLLRRYIVNTTDTAYIKVLSEGN